MAFTPKDAQTQNGGIVADNEIKQGNTPINDDDFDNAFDIGYEDLAPETTPPKKTDPAPKPKPTEPEPTGKPTPAPLPTEPAKPNKITTEPLPTEPDKPKPEPQPTVPNAPKPHAQNPKPEKAKVVKTTNNFVPVNNTPTKALTKKQLYEAKVLKSPTSYGDPTKHASKHAKITKKMLQKDVKRVKADAKKFKAAKTRKKRLAAKKKLTKDKKKLLKDMKTYSRQHKQDKRINKALKPDKTQRVEGIGKATTDEANNKGINGVTGRGLAPDKTFAQIKQEAQAAADDSARKTQEESAWLESSANPMNQPALANHSLKETAEQQANTKSILSPIANAPQADGAEANMQLGQ